MNHTKEFSSLDPATGEIIWEGRAANAATVDAAVKAARHAFPQWSALSFEQRLKYIEAFRAVVEKHKGEMAETIARETGKVLWDSATEVGAMIGKAAAAVAAWKDRTPEKQSDVAGVHYALRHRPHGVLAVFGPYNFPAHLPNGHIMPALLAGNTVVFKPSEQTPLTGEVMLRYWQEAGLPEGVINLVQGERDTGIALAGHPQIDGLLFTGSSATGALLHQQFAGTPEKILALELGGNNPLIVWEVENLQAAAFNTVMSAYLTTGQRCSCARRLIVPDNAEGKRFLDVLVGMVQGLRSGAWTDRPEPFMGPLISNREADRLLAAQRQMLERGATAIIPMKRLAENLPFVSPGLVDVTAVADRPDEEYFGPLLQVIRVPDFALAIAEANRTSFGLTSAILTDKRALYERYLAASHAGVVNWNRQTTGASSLMPFGGVGRSGNHRPSAYYAADYCAYPVASAESESLAMPETLPAGFAS